MLAFAALFLVLIAETGRIPVDNPATHLELTMIHEAMILEYSGPYLALIEWGASIKQLLLMTLLINCFLALRTASRAGRLRGVLVEPGLPAAEAAGAELARSSWWRPPTPRCGSSAFPNCWPWHSPWGRWR